MVRTFDLIFQKIWNRFHLILRKETWKHPAIEQLCQFRAYNRANFCWSSLYMPITFCNILLMLQFLLPISHCSCSHHSLCIGMLLLQCFLKLFSHLFTTCKTSSIKIWFVLITPLPMNLAQLGLSPTLSDSIH